MGERPRYERPTLVRHHTGWQSKAGSAPRAVPQTTLAGVSVTSLVEQHGSPLFVYDERMLRSQAQALRAALLRWIPEVDLAWSYKTCHLQAVCAVFHEEGARAEVVSSMELEKARKAGVPMSKVVYNGPAKDHRSLSAALLGGALVHLDHYDELSLAERIASESGTRPAVGIRVNLDVDGLPRWDRFGFHLDSGQAKDAVRRLLAGNKLTLSALHCHLGTFIQDPHAYGKATEKLLGFVRQLRQELGVEIRSLDIGGGFASSNRPHAQALSSDVRTPSLEAYAAAIGEAFLAWDSSPSAWPRLLVEAGRVLVDDAGTLITTVLATKRLADGRRAIVVDAGVNLLFTAHWYQHRIVPAQATTGGLEGTTVLGPLCMNIDVVGTNVLLPPLHVGDRLLISPVGAYNLTQSQQFITLRPAVVLVRENGDTAVIRRAETLSDLDGPEAMPPWLSAGG